MQIGLNFNFIINYFFVLINRFSYKFQLAFLLLCITLFTWQNIIFFSIYIFGKSFLFLILLFSIFDIAKHELLFNYMCCLMEFSFCIIAIIFSDFNYDNYFAFIFEFLCKLNF